MKVLYSNINSDHAIYELSRRERGELRGIDISTLIEKVEKANYKSLSSIKSEYLKK